MATVASPDAKLLTFRVGDLRYAIAIERVREVTRMPRLSRVPHAPPALLGLANLGGTVVPVLSAATLLGGHGGNHARLIVVDDGEVLGLAVDEARQILSSDAADTTRVPDIGELAASSMPGRGPRRAHGGAAPLHEAATVAAARTLVVFAIGDQEFALPAEAVDQILPVPPGIARMPDGDEVVVGSFALDGAVLPLLSLRALLALPAADWSPRAKVLVARIGGSRLGLMVDGMRSILTVPEDLIDPLPLALNRGPAEARIQALCRLDRGERLVSILAADHLLREDITARILADTEAKPETMPDAHPIASEQFLIFRIGVEEFALPIAAVEEVARLPDRLTRLPKAPAFVQGVMNLRGQVIPVIDQVQRFGGEASSGHGRRVIVVRMEALQAGFVVDAVSDILTVDSAAIRTAPDLGNNATRVFERVANLTDEQRIILIVSPRELLDRAEQDLLLGLGQKGAEGGW